MRRSVLRAMTAAIICFASTVGAQETVVRAGDRIRFHVDTLDSFSYGKLARLTSDSLILQRCFTCVSLSYDRSHVNDLAVFRTSHRGDRFVTGLILGGLVGGGLGAVMANTCRGAVDACELSVLAIPFGAIAGAFLGSAIGFMTGYRWVPIP